MEKEVTIAFMTNYSLDIPSISKQEITINSFYKIFKPNTILNTIIFCDEKPLSKIEGSITLYNGEIYDNYKIPGKQYEENLRNIHFLKDSTFIKTNSLCDGYIKAIELCKTKYLFFLEHDWIFLENIEHSLRDLTKLMDDNHEINNILFNKLNNIETSFQKFYKSKEFNIPLLLTNRQSNNPNLLKVDHAYKIRYPLINNIGCSIHNGIEFYYNINNMKLPNYCGGIECELCEHCKEDEDKVNILGTYIYGPYGLSETLVHSDGCNRALLYQTNITNN
jgi:hypothetical protein